MVILGTFVTRGLQKGEAWLSHSPQLRGGAGLDEVRRLPGHGSLNTTLRYSKLDGADLQRAHCKAGAIERLHLD
jgi:hypothetical protein